MDDLWTKYESFLLNEVSDRRISKLLVMYKICQRGIRGGLQKAKRKEIESFVDDMNRNKFKRIDGDPLSGSTKSDVKKFLKQFYKWYKGNNERYTEHVSWLKTKIRKEERPTQKPVITVEECRDFANLFNKVEWRTLIYLLFDSGFRIGEMLSAKKKDLTWEEFQPGKKCFWINCNSSKTIIRKVPVPIFTKEVSEFKNSLYFKKLQNSEILFKISHANIIQQFKRQSEKLFKDRKITPHVLRHSSATYYSSEFDGNMNLIADRYGWSYSSDELKTYIRRSGAYQKAGARKVFSNEVTKLKEENREIRDRLEKIEQILKKKSIIEIAKKEIG